MTIAHVESRVDPLDIIRKAGRSHVQRQQGSRRFCFAKPDSLSYDTKILGKLDRLSNMVTLVPRPYCLTAFKFSSNVLITTASSEIVYCSIRNR